MATGQNIADEARADLNDGDASNYRWSDADMLRYINAAQRQIVLLLPQANVSEDSISLAIGNRQTLPAGGVKFLALYNRTTITATSVRGAAVTIIEEDALNNAYPTWMTTVLVPGVAGTIDHVLHDPRDPTSYAVFPAPQNTSTGAWVKYAKLPTALGSLAATFGMRDEFINAAIEYVKFRMLTKDGRYGTEPAVRQELWNTFRTSLGLKPEMERKVDPANSRGGGDTNG